MFESKLIRRHANLICQKDAPKMIKSVEDLAELPDAFSLIDGKESTKWHGDGTFATSTKWFYQVYPIFASVCIVFSRQIKNYKRAKNGT